MPAIAESLAEWAYGYEPDAEDLALARRSLLDTVAVTLAARDHPVSALAAELPDAARWAAVGHVLDFDDLHIESTTHISVVIVPAVLAAGGDARAYLAGAGVMARLGTLLGWSHYAAGWHATCTAGAPAAAVAAGVAWGLTPERLATAMALAVPGASGVQAAFGTHGKSLQVGFAAEAGVRAARLARAGATADPRAVDAWLELVGAQGADDAGEGTPHSGRPAVPGWPRHQDVPLLLRDAAPDRGAARPARRVRPRRRHGRPRHHPGGHRPPPHPRRPGHRARRQVQPPVRGGDGPARRLPRLRQPSRTTRWAGPRRGDLMATVETERTEGGAGLL